MIQSAPNQPPKRAPSSRATPKPMLRRMKMPRTATASYKAAAARDPMPASSSSMTTCSGVSTAMRRAKEPGAGAVPGARVSTGMVTLYRTSAERPAHMTTYQLRPMSIGEILDTGLTIYRRQFLTFLGIGVVGYGLSSVMLTYIALSGGFLEN